MTGAELGEWVAPIATIASAAFAAWAAFAASRAANAATRQAEIASKQLISEQRAWLSAKLFADGDIKISDDGMSMHVYADLINLGKTPAYQIVTRIKLFPHWHTSMEDAQSFAAECLNAPDDNKRWGRQLPPGAGYSRPWAPSCSFYPGDLIAPFVVVCLTYRIMQDDTLHQTVLVYDVVKQGATEAAIAYDGTSLIDREDKLIRRENIVLAESSGGFST